MQASIAESLAAPAAPVKVRATAVFGGIVFYSLLGLLVIAVVPYGSAEMWWKAFFVCGVFTLAIVWLIEGYIRKAWLTDGVAVVLPIVVLAVFALLQTINLGSANLNAAETGPAWNAISVDPYQTRFFALQLLALALVCVFLFSYATTERRWRILINVVIAIAVVSAIFGILRQTTQHDHGFVLPLLRNEQGYGQFINRNHFAFLMEMALGLGLGMTIGGGARREQAMIYFAALLSLWTALVLCGSRAGLVAMAAQLIVAALLFGLGNRGWATESDSKVARLVQSRPVQVALVAVLLLGIVVGTVWLGGDRLAARIEESRNELNVETDELRYAVSRNEIWRLTARMIAAHPIAGVGLGAYWATVPKYHDGSGRMTPQEAHNDYLELIASAGIVGAAVLIWFLVIVSRRTRINLQHRDYFRRSAAFGAAVGLTGVAVHSLFDFGLHVMVNAFVLILLIFLATARAPQRTTGMRDL